MNICKNGDKFRKSELTNLIADQFKLTSEERNKPKSSGNETILSNRVGWAMWHLKKAELLSVERGIYSITDNGKDVLKQNPAQIDYTFLMSIPAYKKFNNSGKSRDEELDLEPSKDDYLLSPEYLIDKGHKTIRENVKKELLEKINENSPYFFEKLVLDLVRKLEYGIDHKVLGRTGDGGIDGVIKEDKLGFDEIYLQAKRWKGTVPIHQVRDFAGALMEKKSKKGIFITSSDFSKDAYRYVENINVKIILINGDALTDYMYEYNLGVRVEGPYRIKKIDDDYFND